MRSGGGSVRSRGAEKPRAEGGGRERQKLRMGRGFVSIVSRFRELHESTVAVVTGGLWGNGATEKRIFCWEFWEQRGDREGRLKVLKSQQLFSHTHTDTCCCLKVNTCSCTACRKEVEMHLFKLLVMMSFNSAQLLSSAQPIWLTSARF